MLPTDIVSRKLPLSAKKISHDWEPNLLTMAQDMRVIFIQELPEFPPDQKLAKEKFLTLKTYNQATTLE